MSELNLKVDKGIPLPVFGDWMFSYESEFVPLIESMEIGDSFLISTERVSNARYYMNKAGYRCYTRDAGNGYYRVWKGPKR